MVAAFVAGRRGITQEAVDAWVDDLRRLGDDGAYSFSLDQYLFMATKVGSPVTDQPNRRPHDRGDGTVVAG